MLAMAYTNIVPQDISQLFQFLFRNEAIPHMQHMSEILFVFGE